MPESLPGGNCSPVKSAKSKALTALVTLSVQIPGVQAQEKINFNDHVMPIFRNACLNCHNPDKKKAGLDLSTYEATIQGGENGKILASGNAANSLLFKCVKQTEEPKMPPKGDKLSDAEIGVIEKWIAGQLLESANGKVVAVASNNVQVAAVSLERPAGPAPMPGDLPLEPFVRPGRRSAVVSLAASPWAPLAAVGGAKQVVLYHTETGEPLGVLPFPEGFPSIIRFSRNGQLLLTGGGMGGKSGKVVLWDVKTGERVASVGNEFDQVLGADLSPDQQYVALGGPSKLVKIYSTKDGKLLHTMKKHTDWVTAVAFSPDGRYLASADRNGGIELWEGATGKEYNTLPGHKAMVTSLSFLTGVLASSSEDGTVKLWDAKESKEIRSWTAHPGGAAWVDFTPDGRLASCGRDKIAKAWDQTGKLLGQTPAFGDIALRAALQGDRVIAGDWSGEVRLCTLSGQKLAELSPNPVTVSENLAQARKRLADAEAASLQPRKAAEDAGRAVKEADAWATQQRNAAVAALEQAKRGLAEAEQKLAAAAEAIAQLTKERDAAPEPERPAFAPRIDAANAAKVQAEAAVAGSRKVTDERNAQVGAAEKAGVEKRKVATEAEGKAKAALDQALASVAGAKAGVDKWTRAAEYLAVHQARRTAQDREEAFKTRDAAAKSALQPVEQMRSELSGAEKALADSPVNIQAKEAALATAKTALAGAEKAAADADAAKKSKEEREQTVAQEQSVADAAVPVREAEFNKAKAAVAPTAKAAADAVAAQQPRDAKEKASAAEFATAETALAELAKRKDAQAAEEAAQGKALAAIAEGAPGRDEALAKEKSLREQRQKTEAELAAAKTKLDQARAPHAAVVAEAAKGRETVSKLQANAKAAADAVPVAEKALADAKAKAAQAKAAFDAAHAEAGSLRDAATKAAGVLKQASAAVAAADKALAEARRAPEELAKRIAKLKADLPEATRKAEEAKVRLEKEAAQAQAEMESAKAQAEKIRTGFEGKWLQKKA